MRVRARARVRVGGCDAGHGDVERGCSGGDAVEAEGERRAREAEAHLVRGGGRG